MKDACPAGKDLYISEKDYQEFLEYIKDCRYRGCNHVLEEECGIKYAVADGKIEKSRYENYCMLKNSKNTN